MSRVEVIGNATLYLGDARQILSSVGKFGSVITDPPYKFEKSIRPNKPRGSAARNDTFKRLFETGLHNGFNISELPSADSYIVFCAKNQLPYILGHFWSVDDQRWMLICWHKSRHQHLSGSYAPDTEYIIHQWGKGNLARTGLPRFYFGSSEQLTQHPTEKPIWLMSALLKATSGVVCDPFMGSGTTGIACAYANRPFVGCEIHEPYFDIACRRIEDAQRQGSLFGDAA